MPLILDNSMQVDLNNVDDLFGDNVPLSIPVRPQGKQLRQRLDELRNRGACQTVAWSKSGTIASLTPDGQTLELRFLRCHPDTGVWELSEATTCELVKGSPAIPLVHLEWGPTNTPDLAVIDAAGRVALVSFAISLNHPFINRHWETDMIDDLHGVVGCYWLPLAPGSPSKPFNIMYGPANKNGNVYHYENVFVHIIGPHHPHSSKSAFFCVNSGGMMKMYWPQNNNRWEETTMELESINSSDELVTHAAFASDRKNLLAAIATSSRQLKLLKIEVQWAGPGSSSEKNTMPPNARLNPALVETHVASTSWLCPGPSETNYDASIAELSFLHLLPAIMDSTGSSTAPPLIVTVRSRYVGDGSFQSIQSVLDRWEAFESKQGLDPAFEQLGNRRNSVSSDLANVTRLKKLESVVINKGVIGIQDIQYKRVLIFAMSDGSIEYRDRFTFEELYAHEDLNKVMTMRQVGWTFSDNEPCYQAAFSPTYCSMVQIGDDGKLRWNKLQYPLGDIGNTPQDPHYTATIAALSIAAAFAVWHMSNFDDVLAIARPLTSRTRFVSDFVGDLIRLLKIQVDYSEEMHHDSLMRNSPLQSCLSIMSSLGFRGETHRRTFLSKFSIISLNMRNVVILITLASNTPTNIREKMSPLDEHEVVEALAGCAKWSVDLLCWLIDCLFELMNDDKFKQRLQAKQLGELNQYLHEKNDVSLHLLLSSSSRSFVSALCRRISILENISNKAIDFYKRQASGDQQSGAKPPKPQLQQAYQRMQQVTSTSLIRVAELEKLLNILASDIRQTYASYLPRIVKNQPNPPQGKQLDIAIKNTQAQFEMVTLLSGSLGPSFLPVLIKLFGKELPAFRKLTDPAKLFFADFKLLGLEDDKNSLTARKAKGVHVDIFKRTELRDGGGRSRWRRCTRCTAVMEDVYGSRPGFTFVLAQQRKCSCSGYWALLPKGKEVL
ncbi:Mediator of RNA polymerase II transcription subunit 16 [Metarhizium album ARSEF 1941]|uniref:Mediator of RNA polymerase II transcription subunit 16 n=1 Tax=Metarhizium album (strain ARSEF 1941) TaxID=1081103 RepID=A0A0B2X0U8_METAS|nr:Mediator of RNA polymerase II transcription subunit 16 [Metarhizium album ARSEF 1941]KHN99933.1 Mediator of RNA polymerase II transcription subunit 16 [Metarhizium album ARSEF 1941]